MAPALTTDVLSKIEFPLSIFSMSLTFKQLEAFHWTAQLGSLTPFHRDAVRRVCQRRTKNQPGGGAKVCQFGATTFACGDVRSALARALTT